MTEKQLKAMISSTSLDLPEHRKEVLEACQRQSVFSIRMEDLHAHVATAETASLKLVEEADIYIGVFAHRYGHIPKENNPDKISITEMEYNRAIERGIHRMIFIMHEDHPIKISDVEQGEGAEKLKTLLERIKTGNDIVKFFLSPADLRAEVINSLSQYKQELIEKRNDGGKLDPGEFHYISRIPEPPEIYIAHPYSLLQTGDLIGRQKELSKLTDWVAQPDSEVYKKHILNIVAIGGMGKSALTWKWFNDIAPEKMKPLAGRMWWSFYEREATFENFVVRALAYVSKRPVEAVQEIPSGEREAELLTALNRELFLIVLDGLERILIAYAGGDAARQKDNEIDEQKNRRKTIDPRIGNFLKKLARIENSRILISTRLFPTEFETDGGDELPGVARIDLPGLTEDDAIQLWRAFDVSGSRELLLPIFDSIERHPLLIQALAGEVKRYKRAPGNFEKWLAANPHFDPASIPRVQDAMAHVMEYALKKLGEKPKRVLEIISAFRMPTAYETLAAVVLTDESTCKTEIELDLILIELEDRGLLGWDKRANRYDLHPIVRGTIWNNMENDSKKHVHTRLHDHFRNVPLIDDAQINNLEDITPAVELYYSLIGLERYDEACTLFYHRLQYATLFRFRTSRHQIELIEALFPNGQTSLPSLTSKRLQSYALNVLANGYRFWGLSKRAIDLQRLANSIDLETDDKKNYGIGLSNLSSILQLTGSFNEAEFVARKALIIGREQGDSLQEAVSLQFIGLILAARGDTQTSKMALLRPLQINNINSNVQASSVDYYSLAKRSIWLEDFADAKSNADQAWKMAEADKNEGDFVRAARMQGEAALGKSEITLAHDKLHDALIRSRNIAYKEEEIPILIALAKFYHPQEDEKSARKALDDVWEYAERGPYPLYHADALNVLAQIERDAGNTEEAIKAAAKAYELAWCDGPPYAYHWGLIKAQKHLEELGAALPEMPPFDESKFEPMPDVEINPRDEFYVDENEEN